MKFLEGHNLSTHHELLDTTYAVLAPAALGSIFRALESLSQLGQYKPTGLLQGRSSLRGKGLIPRCARAKLDSMAAAAILHGLSLVGAAVVLSSRNSRSSQVIGSTLTFVAHSLTETRNPFGGDGADQMSEIIAGYRALTALIRDEHLADDLFLRAVNAQASVAYCASGLAKVISSAWRSGTALNQILRTRLYGESALAQLLQKHSGICRLISWTTLIWETLFPLIYLLRPQAANRALLLIKIFHLGIAATMGLPRFFWAFNSSHYAVSYVIRQRNLHR